MGVERWCPRGACVPRRLGQLLPENDDVARRVDADLHPVAVDLEDLDRDVALDDDLLIDLAAQNQHRCFAPPGGSRTVRIHNTTPADKSFRRVTVERTHRPARRGVGAYSCSRNGLLKWKKLLSRPFRMCS